MRGPRDGQPAAASSRGMTITLAVVSASGVPGARPRWRRRRVQDVRRDPDPEAIAAFDAARAAAGVPPSDLSEKLTTREARELVAAAGIDGATLEAPADGPGAIGFEITIRRPLD